MNNDKRKKKSDIYDSTTEFFLSIIKKEESEAKKERDFSAKETLNVKTSKTIDKVGKVYRE